MEQEITSQRIFHYTKMESGLNILFEKRLRLNSISKTNDPRETRSWNLLPLKDFGQQHNADVDQANDVIENIIPRVMMKEWKVLCFTLDSSTQNEKTEPSTKKLYATFLDPGYTRPRMWAQYADNHKGVCLLFDKSKLDEKVQQEFEGQCFPGEVGYDGEAFVDHSIFPPISPNLLNDIKNLGPKEAARKYVFDHYPSLFLRKNPDWATETEYRWLIHSTIKEIEDIPIEGTIKAVLVSLEFSKIYEAALIPLCKELGIPAKRILWHNGMPKSEFETIYEPEI